MQLRVEELEAAAVVSLPGDHLDASNVEDFREAMAPVLRRYDHVLLDLGDLGFVDSSGLGAILSALRHLKAKKGMLRIFGAGEQVRLLFDLVKLHRLVDIVDTKEEAIKSLET